MMMPMVWTPGLFVLMFVMWSAMMMAMMLPSAAPMILLFRPSIGDATPPKAGIIDSRLHRRLRHYLDRIQRAR